MSIPADTIGKPSYTQQVDIETSPAETSPQVSNNKRSLDWVGNRLIALGISLSTATAMVGAILSNAAYDNKGTALDKYQAIPGSSYASAWNDSSEERSGEYNQQFTAIMVTVMGVAASNGLTALGVVMKANARAQDKQASSSSVEPAVSADSQV